MRQTGFKIPLGVQIGAVVLLFAAATAMLWSTGAAVVERERRRGTAQATLTRVGDELEARGRASLEAILRGPSFMFVEGADRVALEERLTEVARQVVARFPAGVEGGFLVLLPGESRFVPAMPSRSATGDAAPTVPDSLLLDSVETQADAAIRKRRVLLVVEVVAPRAATIRTAPVRVNGRVVAATWAMVRLEDPLFVDRSVRGYRISAALALSGIALSLVLTLGLTRTVRRQGLERERLQTELRRNERLAALGKLLAGVSHEVRNPLAGIRSTVQLWQRGIGHDDESFDDLLAEVDHLEEIVSRLLQFSRADAQDLVPGNLNAVVVEAASLARRSAEERGVRIELDLDPALPMVAMAPPALLQIFRNLTTNAVQAMPSGGMLKLATQWLPARRQVEARIEDNGPGLSVEATRHLFEPFFTTKAGGTGLGLAIAHEIALAHRGSLRAERRTDGGGAVFILSLPVA
ncbi:MAG: ATP-binding protein [Isosphaeraceae bacterium]